MSADVTKELLEALKEIHNWLVCAPIATAEDMAESFPYMERLAEAAIARAEAAMAEPQPDADGWIPWKGGECPVDEKVLVEVKLRSGSAWIDQEAQMGADWLWDHYGGPDDIIAYRLVKP